MKSILQPAFVQPKGRQSFYISKGLLKEKEETEKEEGGGGERGLEYVIDPHVT